jgi:hypothetical protein
LPHVSFVPTSPYLHAVYWNFNTLAGLEKRRQAQMNKDFKLKTSLALRPFQRAHVCPILISGHQIMLEKTFFLGKGPSQGQIPELQGHGSQIPSVLFTNRYQRKYVENLRSLGAIVAEK